jgi:hypothetical protein
MVMSKVADAMMSVPPVPVSENLGVSLWATEREMDAKGEVAVVMHICNSAEDVFSFVFETQALAEKAVADVILADVQTGAPGKMRSEVVSLHGAGDFAGVVDLWNENFSVDGDEYLISVKPVQVEKVDGYMASE